MPTVSAAFVLGGKTEILCPCGALTGIPGNKKKRKSGFFYNKNQWFDIQAG
jgi:hypothetical protein